MGALTVSSAQNRFLLLGGLLGDQPLNLSPNVDPVQLAISYSKWNDSQQQVLAVGPGESPAPSLLFIIVFIDCIGHLMTPVRIQLGSI